MKHFLGTVIITDYDSRREYERVCALAARDEAAAEKLLAEWAATWDDNGKQDDSGWTYSLGDGAYHVMPNGVQPITPAAFDSVKTCMVSFIEPGCPGQLLEESDDERVRTLARRLGNQLQKHDVKVPHGKLLHAVAASLGETDWQVLLAKSADKKTEIAQAASRVVAAAAGTSEQDQAWATNGGTQPFVPGKGYLWRVPVTVNTTMTTNVLVRARNKEEAIDSARRFAHQGNARFEVDDGNYCGIADHYVGDKDSVQRLVDTESFGKDETPPRTFFAQSGPYLVELFDLGDGGEEEMMWADLTIFDPTLEEPDTESCMSTYPVKSHPEKLRLACQKVASLLHRGAPDASKVDRLTLLHVFINAVQGDQGGEAYGKLEAKLIKANSR